MTGACASPAGEDIVDIVLDLEAEPLAPGFEAPLYEAIARKLPWLEGLAGAGIHPLRCTAGAGGEWLVGRRAKLMIRIPREKVCAASVLEGARLTVGASRLRVGQGTFRRLAAAATLYSPRVVTGDEQEAAFLDSVSAELERLEVRGRLICGRRSTVGDRAAWSLAVHDLASADSLALQRRGVGLLRHLGCGILLPHKTIQTPE